MRSVLIALALSTALAVPAASQAPVNLAVHGGSMSGVEAPASGAELGSAGVAGLSASARMEGVPFLHGRIAVFRTTGTAANQSGADVFAGDNPSVWHADLSLLAGRELGSSSVTVFPYVLGGAGQRFFRFDGEGRDQPFSKSAYHAGGGTEVRYGRIGVFAEGRSYWSELEGEGTSDTVYTLGLTLRP